MFRTAVAVSWLTAAMLACLGGVHVAQAQNPQPAPPTAQPAPVGPPNSPSPPPERIVPADPPARQGTVRPPNVDPGMTVQPPANTRGTMPIVPPPGSPGGNQTVIPK